jgi:hypothetical protein
MLTCKRGTIRRKAYTRKSGRKIVATCIKNRGAPGRWRTVHRSKGIGPLKEGRLERFNYKSSGSLQVRRTALRAASRRLGALSVFRMLNALATYTKRTSPSKSAKYLADRNYVRKQLF